MPATEPGKIRNIAVVGHRGVGKTSLVEALLFQAGKTNRLGSIGQGTTVSDWEDDEHRRQMSLSGTLTHLEWQDRKINLIDCPGDAGFQADTYAALRVVEGALVVLSGVMGVEVNTSRVWARAEEYELSRVLFVNMLDRAARPARRGRSLAGAQGHDNRVRRREAGGIHLQDDRRSVRGSHQLLPRARGAGHRRHDARRPAHAREGAPRPDPAAAGQG